MRFEDFAKEIVATVEKARAEAERRRPEQEAEYQRELSANRCYQVGDDLEVRFDAIGVARNMAYGSPVEEALRFALRLQSVNFTGAPPAITSESLLHASAAVHHIEQWVKGEIDELAPSGVWGIVAPAAAEVS